MIGDDRVSANPKLNNVVKGWKAARHEWVIIADSNVLMPPDYIQRLIARWRPNTGIVCAPPIGSQPQSFGAEIECAFLNTYEARWQYAAEAVGFGFAQGKTMLWRRDIMEAGGGIEALGAEIAEDAASTKLIHAQGYDAHLVSEPFQQPLGARKLKDVWARQVRWARLRRATFPLHFAPEILTTSLVMIVAAAFAAPEFGLSPWVSAALAAAVLVRDRGPARPRRRLAAELAEPARLDRLATSSCPCCGRKAGRGDNFVWRGNAMSVDEAEFRRRRPGRRRRCERGFASRSCENLRRPDWAPRRPQFRLTVGLSLAYQRQTSHSLPASDVAEVTATYGRRQVKREMVRRERGGGNPRCSRMAMM